MFLVSVRGGGVAFAPAVRARTERWAYMPSVTAGIRLNNYFLVASFNRSFCWGIYERDDLADWGLDDVELLVLLSCWIWELLMLSMLALRNGSSVIESSLSPSMTFVVYSVPPKILKKHFTTILTI